MVIPVALSTGSAYTYGTERLFDLASRAGYDGVEVIVDDRWDTRQPEYLRHLVDRFQVPVLSVHSPFMPVSGWPDAEIGRVQRALEVAEAMGARTLNLHPPHRVATATIIGFGWRWRIISGPARADQRAYGRWLLDGGLQALQAQTAVRIVVENMPYWGLRWLPGGRFSPSALNTWEELSLFPQLCLDTTHCGTSGSDLLAVQERLGGRVQHVHLSDWDGKHQHQPIGRGHLPLGQFLQRLAARDYPGIVVVELAPQGLPVHDEALLEAELRRHREFCRTHLESHSTTAAKPDRSPVTSTRSAVTPNLPPVIPKEVTDQFPSRHDLGGSERIPHFVRNDTRRGADGH